jgi:hypothetical protein
MKFVYFTLPDGSYLSMNNLQNSGEFKKNTYFTPTLFPQDTKLEYVYAKIKNRPDVNAIITRTFTV